MTWRFELGSVRPQPVEAVVTALLVLAAVVAACSFVAPVFGGSGALLNQDHPTHYQRLWAFVASDQPALVPSWNPHMNAGRPYSHGYPLLFHAIARGLCWVAEPVSAYKLAVALVHAIAPLAVFVLLAVLRRPLAGAFAAAICLVAPGSPQSGGFAQLFLAGLVPSSLATALVPVALAAVLWFLDEPGRRRLAVAASAAALLLVAHVISFSYFALALLVIGAAHHHVLGRREVLALPVLTGGLAAFWLMPMAVRRLQGYFAPAFEGNIGRSMYSSKLFFKYFWDPLSKPLLVLGLLGLVVALVARGEGSRGRRAVAFITPIVPVLWLLEIYGPGFYDYVPIDRVLQLQRLAAESHLLLILFAGLFLGELARVRLRVGERLRPAGFVIAAAVGLGLGLSMGVKTARLSHHIYTLPDGLRAQHDEFYRLVGKHPGRVMHEQTMFQVPPPLGFTHLEMLMSTYHRGESVAFDGFGFQEDWGLHDLGDLLRERAPDAAAQRALFERLNVRYVITTTAETERLLHGTHRIATVPPWTLHTTRIEPSWFELDGGEILERSYRQTAAETKVLAGRDGKLLFKVHDYPNWQVRIDGQAAHKVNEPGALMEIAVAAGAHDVSFRYGLTVLDVLAYAVSVMSGLLAVWLGRR